MFLSLRSHIRFESSVSFMCIRCLKEALWFAYKDFDVTMAAKDGAEIAELTGIYLLEQINVFLKTVNTRCQEGLYRDDGLIYVENSN